MEYKKLTDENIAAVVKQYVEYYNNSENGCWTYEKAYKRIHQFMTIEYSDCLVQYDGENIAGFVMGYYKQFDDIKAYFLEEIVVFKNYQNSGCGTELMLRLEEKVKSNDAEHIELLCVNDEHHSHFYNKIGYYASKKICMMGKHFKQ